MSLETPSVVCLELVAEDGERLPDFAPGAHVDVSLPNRQVRSYSLVGRSPDDLGLRIGIKREADSRGGSAWFHDVARLGMVLEITEPKGEFKLVEDAPETVFLAGGIGITPLLPMMRRLNATERPWQLHYAAASPIEMPFMNLVHELAGERRRVQKYFSRGSASRMNICDLMRGLSDRTHAYCCGPAAMINAFVEANVARDPRTVHFERFATDKNAATSGGFVLELARDGRKLPVPEGKSVLDVLLDAGIDVPYSCGQGVCGSCQTRVLAGQPDHRDCFLTEDERAANDSMLVCCSGARSSHLVLDL